MYSFYSILKLIYFYSQLILNDVTEYGWMIVSHRDIRYFLQQKLMPQILDFYKQEKKKTISV